MAALSAPVKTRSAVEMVPRTLALIRIWDLQWTDPLSAGFRTRLELWLCAASVPTPEVFDLLFAARREDRNSYSAVASGGS